jgi:hypothetical protein
MPAVCVMDGDGVPLGGMPDTLAVGVPDGVGLADRVDVRVPDAVGVTDRVALPVGVGGASPM